MKQEYQEAFNKKTEKMERELRDNSLVIYGLD
jgi:hypothetical protein